MNWNTVERKKLISLFREWIVQTVLRISLVIDSLNRSDSKECELNSGGSQISNTLINTCAINCTLKEIILYNPCVFCIFRWFFGKMSRFEALSHLMFAGNDNGSFLVRISETDSTGFVISGVYVVFWFLSIVSLLPHILKPAIGDWSSESSLLVRTLDKAKHFKIYQSGGKFYVDPSPTFASVLEVVEYYRTHPLSTSDQLKRPCVRVRLSFSSHFSPFSSYACFFSLPYSHILFQFCQMRKWLKEFLHFYENTSFCLFVLETVNICNIKKLIFQSSSKHMLMSKCKASNPVNMGRVYRYTVAEIKWIAFVNLLPDTTDSSSCRKSPGLRICHPPQSMNGRCLKNNLP